MPTLLVKFRLLLRKRMDMDGKFMNTKSKLSEIISQMLQPHLAPLAYALTFLLGCDCAMLCSYLCCHLGLVHSRPYLFTRPSLCLLTLRISESKKTSYDQFRLAAIGSENSFAKCSSLIACWTLAGGQLVAAKALSFKAAERVAELHSKFNVISISYLKLRALQYVDVNYA